MNPDYENSVIIEHHSGKLAPRAVSIYGKLASLKAFAIANGLELKPEYKMLHCEGGVGVYDTTRITSYELRHKDGVYAGFIQCSSLPHVSPFIWIDPVHLMLEDETVKSMVRLTFDMNDLEICYARENRHESDHKTIVAYVYFEGRLVLRVQASYGWENDEHVNSSARMQIKQNPAPILTTTLKFLKPV